MTVPGLHYKQKLEEKKLLQKKWKTLAWGCKTSFSLYLAQSGFSQFFVNAATTKRASIFTDIICDTQFLLL